MTDARHAVGVGLIAWFIAQQFQRARGSLSVADVASIVETINRGEFNGWFRLVDVLAIVQIESSFDPDAHRFEPHVRTALTPEGDSSVGLMQILFSTAVDRGYLGGPAALFDPVVNVRFGMRQMLWSWEFLAARLGRTPSTAQWIGSYNAGVGNVLKGRIPEIYVARWVRAREALSAP